MMGSVHSRTISGYPPENSTLKRIFDLYAEETITDEQVERVLAPVRRMIEEGRFDRVRRPARPMTLAASVAALVVIVAMAQGNQTNSAYADIPEDAPPLAAAAPAETMPTDHVTLAVKGVSGVNLTLIGADDMEIYGHEMTGEDGTCVFEDIPEGTYQIVATLPSNMTESMDAGIWIVADGKAKLLQSGDSEKLWEGVDVQVCRAK